MDEDSYLEMAYEDRTHLPDEQETQDIDFDVEQGWPGDGSGTDDLADANANEADDYLNE